MKAEYRISDIIVAKKRRFRETSAIVEAFSDKYGYLHLMAKGIFRKNSSVQGLEPLSVNSITYFYKPGRELNTITECKLEMYPERIVNDYNAYLYINRIFAILKHHRFENEGNISLYRSFHSVLLSVEREGEPERAYADFLVEYMNTEGIYLQNDRAKLKKSIDNMKLSAFIEEAENRIRRGH